MTQTRRLRLMFLVSSLIALLNVVPAWSQATVQESSSPDASVYPPAEKATHEALIALRKRVLEAYQKKDIDALLKELHPQVMVTWQNGEVNQGPEAIRKFYKDMLEGPNSVVKDIKTTLTIDKPSKLYHDQTLAVVGGKLDDDFTLRDGKQFHLTSPWTATLIKEGDEWKILAFHVSTNMFDNGVLNLMVQENRLYVGLAAGIGGLVLGAILFKILRPRSAKTT